MKITSNVIYLKHDNFYTIDDDTLKKLELSDIASFDNYTIIIDDSYFFYFTPDFPVKNIRKLKPLIHNYLIGNYPENLIKYYDFIEKKGKVLLYIISEDLISILNKNIEIFQNANRIISPFLILWEKDFNGEYFDGLRFYKLTNSTLRYAVNLDNCIDTEKVLTSFDLSLNNQLSIPGLKKQTGIFSKYKTAIIVCSIAYIFFVAGLLLHIISEKKNLLKIDEGINLLYKKAGIGSNTADPYGLLLYKASKGKKNKGVKILPIFEIISVSLPENTTIKSFYYKKKILKIEGVTSDFIKIDQFKNNLSKSLKGEVIIGNTIKQNNEVKFTITCKLAIF